jgi:Flp pilus assembly protein TadG
MSMPLSLVPMLFFLLWLGLIAYGIVLATRLVSAVEQIARAMTQRFPESPRP